MSVGRVAMIALFAALTAGCAAPRESGTADAVPTPEQESGPAVAGDGTRSTPASPEPADDVPASVPPPVAQPAWFAPEEVDSAAASSTAAASAPVPPETPEPVRPQTVSSGPKTPSARPAREEIAEAEGSTASLRDRSEAGGRGAREGQDPRGQAFSRHTIGDCAVIRQLGHSIALSRGRGAGESEAIRAGIDRMVDEFGLAHDQRTKFTSRVYGLLVYRLDAGHSTQALTSYTHAVCRIYHDSNRIIPVDPASERAINDRLRACDRNTVARDELEDCVLRGLVEIVDRAA